MSLQQPSTPQPQQSNTAQPQLPAQQLTTHGPTPTGGPQPPEGPLIRFTDWLRKQLTPGKITRAFLRVISYLVFGAIIAGILGNASFEYFRDTVIPSLGEPHVGLTNGAVLLGALLLSLGWIFTILFGIAAILLFGSDQRKYGQLKDERTERAQLLLSNTNLQAEIITLKDEVENLRRMSSTNMTQILDTFAATERELLWLVSQGKFTVSDRNRLLESMCRRTFDLFDRGQHSFRAAVYLPEDDNDDYLVIKWDLGVGDVSRRYNRWYVGGQDAYRIGAKRGICGTVYVRGEGRVVPDVLKDPDFFDPQERPSSQIPYRSLVQAVIHPDDLDYKYGVLSIDSYTYIFTEDDLSIVNVVARRIGWYLHLAQQRLGKTVFQAQQV